MAAGAGFFGVCAAASALDGGAKVVMLEKLGDSVHKEAGCILDAEDVIRELMSSSAYRLEARLLRRELEKRSHCSGTVHQSRLEKTMPEPLAPGSADPGPLRRSDIE